MSICYQPSMKTRSFRQMTKPNLIFGLDDFIREKSVFEKVLLVTLTDGSLLYQDDGRFGPDDKFWVRLKAAVESGEVPFIKSIDLYYREQLQEGLSNSDVFFYTRRAIAEMGQPTINQILIGRGHRDINARLKVISFNDIGWSPYEGDITEIRDISSCNPETLIYNKY